MSIDLNKNIQSSIAVFAEEIKALSASLQKEFEHLLQNSKIPDGILKSKKRQIKCLDFLSNQLLKIINISENLYELQEKTEFCLINYGVSYYEFKSFINQPLKTIVEKAKENKKEKSVQLPIVFRDLLYSEPVEEKKEVKYATKPSFDIEKLKAIAEKNPGYLKTGINSLNDKVKGVRL